MRKLALLAIVGALGTTPLINGQEREDRTLLSWDQMRAIINEASGERSLHTVLEMVPYPRLRPAVEYEKGPFRESEVMARLAKEYGFSNVEIETFPQSGTAWQAARGELWLTSPELTKLYDVHDVAVTVASGSESGDVTADLVDVGAGGRAADYEGKDVKGRIVLGSGSSSVLQRLAVFERGAVGVISYNPVHPDGLDQDQIGSQSVSANAPEGRKPGFGWSVSPRMGHALASRLGRGEKLTIRSVIEAQTFPSRMETVHAVIPGDGSTSQEIAMSGHLYEGYLKQGANDDASGCAVTLEMGRTFMRLVAEGKLPKPKRTIHFLWVPEISGTRAWLTKHTDVQKRLVADLNFDMEGLRLGANGSIWVMHRTPDTFPTYLNDVGASIMQFIAELNRERVRYRSGGYGFTLPVLSPNGSTEPFYTVVDKHYGASDHVVYMGMGIPSLMFITWPDPYYHSSHDIPEKLDSTQFKRAAVVGAAAMTVLTTADDAMASRIAAEALARGTERMGQAERKGLSYLADVADAAALAGAYKDALNAVRHQAGIEKATARSAAVLFADPAGADKRLSPLDGLVEQRANALLNEVKAYYKLQAERLKVPATEPAPTDAEQRAARLLVQSAGGAGGPGMGGGGRRGGGGQVTPEMAAVQAAMRKIPSHMTSEMSILVGKNRTVLEIRDFLAGEFEPVPVEDLLTYFEAQQKAGLVKLTEKPTAPASGGKQATAKTAPAKKH
jgi:aminopeptidase YwaD